MTKEVLEAARTCLKQLTGLDILMDPQPLTSSKPHLRLTFTGTGDAGETHDLLYFQLSIVGAGDGPDVYLPKVINASLAIADLYRNAYVDFKANEALSVRIGFPDTLSNSGQFVRQGEEETENSSWAYVYTEPHVITLDFNRSLRG